MSQVDAPKEEKKETGKGRKNAPCRPAPIRNERANIEKLDFIHMESFISLPERLKYTWCFVNAFTQLLFSYRLRFLPFELF
jgi:hypothetical protein